MLMQILIFLAGLYLGFGLCYACALSRFLRKESWARVIIYFVLAFLLWPLAMKAVRENQRGGSFSFLS